jgi:hypothetical protein
VDSVICLKINVSSHFFEDRNCHYVQSVKHAVVACEVCLIPNFVLVSHLLTNILWIFYFEF